MDTVKVTEISEKLKIKLPTARFEHTKGVAYTAAALAMRYELDMDKAYMAGLLHDCAKFYSGEKLLEKCLKNGLEVSDSEREQPDLLHAKYGAYLAKTKYDIEDEEILHSITYHTTGCEDMSLFDMIIYVADYIEPNRNKAPNLDYYRHLAFVDIRKCTLEILESTVSYVEKKRSKLDPTTLKAYQSLKRSFANDN